MAISSYRGRGRLPRIGKIHLGVKAKTAQGVEYPRAVDYFVCPDELRADTQGRPYGEDHGRHARLRPC